MKGRYVRSVCSDIIEFSRKPGDHPGGSLVLKTFVSWSLVYLLQVKPYKVLLEVLPDVAHRWWARVLSSPFGRRLAQGVFWSVSGAVAGRGLALLSSIITARLLGKTPFGELGIVQSTFLMFSAFASFGMGSTATKHVAEYRESDPARAGRIIAMSSAVSWASGLVSALALAILAPWLARHTLSAPQLTVPLRLASVCLFFGVVNEAQLGTLSGFEAFKELSVVQFVAGVAGFPFAVAGVYWFGLKGAIWGLAIGQGLVVFFNFVALRKLAARAGVHIRWKLTARELRVLWTFSLPTLFGAVVYVPAMWVANTILVNAPNGYSEMGIFSAADRWRTAIRFLPSLLSGVVLPMLSSLQGTSNRGRYNRVLWTNVKLSFGLSLAAALPIALFAHWIMASYGHEFAEGKWVLVNLCAISVITGTWWMMGNALVSQGRVWGLFFVNLQWAAILVLACWFLRTKGAQGLAIAYLVAEGMRLLCIWLMIKGRGVHDAPPVSL